jgi:hypothetical protein
MRDTLVVACGANDRQTRSNSTSTPVGQPCPTMQSQPAVPARDLAACAANGVVAVVDTWRGLLGPQHYPVMLTWAALRRADGQAILTS